MTVVRRNIWNLGTAQNPWHAITLGYAKAVRAMQELPISDPRSWRYQAAIHGISGVSPPSAAPWNVCQHQSWYFLPWHRMYLYHFEQIARSFVPFAQGQANWALPYWDYSSGSPAARNHQLPIAFRAPNLPDGSPNPLFVAARRASVNSGNPLPFIVYDTTQAMAETRFTGSPLGGSPGFGGPQTGFFHGGRDGTFGVLESTPHGSVHVHIGGQFGLMFNPNTAALDPIFWLHHANLDRLWTTWDPGRTRNPTIQAWLNRSFRLRTVTGAAVVMRPREVLDTVTDLDYTYDSLPAVLAADEEVTPMPRRRRQPLLIGASERPVMLDPSGASAEVNVGALPAERAAAAGTEPRVFLNVADIEGTRNPGVVYGVYLNLPNGASEATQRKHLAGVVSFFGIESSTPAGARSAGRQQHGMRYSFDVTDLVGRLRAQPDWDPEHLQITLLPAPDSEEPEPAAAGAAPQIRIGTFALYQE
jgi:hypothetical protein